MYMCTVQLYTFHTIVPGVSFLTDMAHYKCSLLLLLFTVFCLFAELEVVCGTTLCVFPGENPQDGQNMARCHHCSGNYALSLHICTDVWGFMHFVAASFQPCELGYEVCVIVIHYRVRLGTRSPLMLWGLMRMRINALPKGTSALTWFRTRVTGLRDHCSTNWAIAPPSKCLITMMPYKIFTS